MYIRTGCLFMDTSSFMSNYYKVFVCSEVLIHIHVLMLCRNFELIPINMMETKDTVL